MKYLTIITLLTLSLSPIAYGQHKPEPPKAIDEDAIKIDRFDEVYSSLNQPRISVQTVVASRAFDTTSLTNLISDINALDSAIKTEILKASNVDMALSSPGLYRINDSEPDLVVNGVIDPWGCVRYQVTSESDNGVMEQLRLEDPIKAATAIGVRDDAEYVLLTKILISHSGVDGGYSLIDVKRNQLISTHSWKFLSEKVITDDWRSEYGRAIAIHAMGSFADTKRKREYVDERNCELIVRSNENLVFEQLVNVLRERVPQIIRGSVKYRGEDSSGDRTNYSFTYRIHGDLGDLRNSLLAGISELGFENLTFYSVTDESIELQIGDFENSHGAESPDFAFMKKCVPNIKVTLVDDDEGKMVGTGSGMLLSLKGHIITNKHVVENEFGTVESITVIYENGDAFEAELVYKSQQLDIAILKIPSNGPKLKCAKECSVGERVFAFGYPSVASEFLYSASESENQYPSYDKDLMAFTVTQGILSSIEEVGSSFGTLLITDAAIYPGNSGGPLTNSDGLVVGMSTIGHPDVPINGAIAWQSIRDDLLSAGFHEISWPN